MHNYKNDNTARRYMAYVSQFGTSQFHLRNPYIIAWWSAAMPGFGHLLLNKFLRGFALVAWEIIINYKARLNEAMVYTFTGHFDAATHVLNERWMLLYIPVYLFAIWDSYRTTVDMNKISILAKRENHRFNTLSLGALEINYLDKRNPLMAVMWSLFMPGTGQLYIHRITSAFFVLVWIIITTYYSHYAEALTLIFMGNWQKATEVINMQWFMFLPSIYGFAIYDSYVSSVENNKLFDLEQSNFLKREYQNRHFKVQFDDK